MKTDFAHSKFFSIYEKIVLIATFLFFFLYFLYFTLSSLPDNCQVQCVEKVKSLTKNFYIIISRVTLLFVSLHIMFILIQALYTKHSVIWLISRQLTPIVVPITVLLFIMLFSGQLDDIIPDLFVGIFSGFVSSIIVLLLDQNHTLAEIVLKNTAPEFMQNNKDEGDSKQDF